MPYRARNVFSILNATNLLPRWGIVILTFNLVIGYWLFPIESNDNLSPDRPLAPCALPLAPTPALIRIFVHNLTIT